MRWWLWFFFGLSFGREVELQDYDVESKGGTSDLPASERIWFFRVACWVCAFVCVLCGVIVLVQLGRSSLSQVPCAVFTLLATTVSFFIGGAASVLGFRKAR